MKKQSFVEKANISVVIPTLGREELLLDCVKSILIGTYNDFEILIIDQNPKLTLQNKLTQCFPYEKRLRYFYREKAGAARARNFGLSNAIGEIIVFIDDDLIVGPDCLQAYYDQFQLITPPPGIISGRIIPIWPNKNKPDWFPIELEYILGLYDIGDEVCLMPQCDQPMSANIAVLRKAILEIGGFNENFGFDKSRKQPMIAGEDTLLGIKIREAGYSIYYHPRAQVGHRISVSKLSKIKFLHRLFWEGVTIILEMESLGKLDHRRDHIIYHSKYALKMFVLFVFPRLTRRSNKNNNLLSSRMLHLAQVYNSLGVIYALFNINQLRRI